MSSGHEEHTTVLEPHTDGILAVEFSPSGRTVATASADKLIRLTSIYSPNEVLLTLKGHKRAVTEAHWSRDGDRMFSCSADSTAAVWDLCTGQRIKRLEGHEYFVNSCCIGKELPNIAVTGADDGCMKVWDLRIMRDVATFKESHQILSVTLDDSMYRAFSASLSGKIRVYDIRKVVISPPSSYQEEVVKDPALLSTLSGHQHAITGMRLTSDHSILASTSMDDTVRVWDARPFCARGEENRCFAVIRGPSHNFEYLLHRVRWDTQNSNIAVGSGDRCAYVFSLKNVESGAEPAKLLYKFGGHRAACTEVDFHPSEPIIASGGSDKTLIIRRLAPIDP